MPPLTNSKKIRSPLGLTKEEEALKNYSERYEDEVLLILRVGDLTRASGERSIQVLRPCIERGKGAGVEIIGDGSPPTTGDSRKARSLRPTRNQRNCFTAAGSPRFVQVRPSGQGIQREKRRWFAICRWRTSVFSTI